MYLAVAEATFRLASAGSLKDKRRIRRKLLEGLRGRFGAAAAEVSDQDRHQLLTVAWVLIAAQPSVLRPVLDRSVEWAMSVAGDPVRLEVDLK